MQNPISLFFAGILVCLSTGCQPDIAANDDNASGKKTPAPDGSQPDKTPDNPDMPSPETPDDSCEWANDGFCDEPTYCVVGTDVTDCSAEPRPADDSCQYANDGECDEPTYCVAGTDTTDCADGGGGDGGGDGPDSCQYANDGECDEPAYCAVGTDSTDCADGGGGGGGGGDNGISMGDSCGACAGNPACIAPASDDCGTSDTAGTGWCISAFGSQGTCTQSCSSVSCPEDYGCVDLYGGSFCIQ